jgi:hypothetical protein
MITFPSIMMSTASAPFGAILPVARAGSTGRLTAALAVVTDGRDPAAIHDIIYINNHVQHIDLTACRDACVGLFQTASP